MPTSSSTRHMAWDVLFAAIACVAALELFYWTLEQWATLRIWEPWVLAYPNLGLVGPFVGIALVCGIVIGAVIGVLVRTNPLRVAVLAGVAVPVLSFGAALLVGGLSFVAGTFSVIGPPALALGFLAGAVLGRRVRHA